MYMYMCIINTRYPGDVYSRYVRCVHVCQLLAIVELRMYCTPGCTHVPYRIELFGNSNIVLSVYIILYVAIACLYSITT